MGYLLKIELIDVGHKDALAAKKAPSGDTLFVNLRRGRVVGLERRCLSGTARDDSGNPVSSPRRSRDRSGSSRPQEDQMMRQRQASRAAGNRSCWDDVELGVSAIAQYLVESRQSANGP